MSNAVLFNAMYEQGENLSLVDTLVKIGTAQLGIENDRELRQYLEQDDGLAQIRREIEVGRRMYGISSVPFFVIGRLDDPSGQPYGISGAQKVTTFLDLFTKLLGDEGEISENNSE